jgi:hypothetical protein
MRVASTTGHATHGGTAAHRGIAIVRLRIATLREIFRPKDYGSIFDIRTVRAPAFGFNILDNIMALGLHPLTTISFTN